MLGVLVVVNSLYESEARPAAHACGQPSRRWRSCSVLGLQDAAACSAFDLRALVVLDDANRSPSGCRCGACSAGDADRGPRSVAIAARRGRRRGTRGWRQRGSEAAGSPRAWRCARSSVTMISLVVLLMLGVERVYTQLRTGRGVRSSSSLRSGRLSRLDNARLERGYYENLLGVDSLQLPALGGLREAADELARDRERRAQALHRRLRAGRAHPVASSPIRTTGRITINRWGMRDRDYEHRPRPGRSASPCSGRRTSWAGASADGETFEALLEKPPEQRARGTHRSTSTRS